MTYHKSITSENLRERMAVYLIFLLSFVIHSSFSTQLPCTHPDVCCVFGNRFTSGDVMFSMESSKKGHCFSIACYNGSPVKTQDYSCDVKPGPVNSISRLLLRSFGKTKQDGKRADMLTTMTMPPTVTTTIYNPTPLHCYYKDPVSGVSHWWHGGTTQIFGFGKVCRCEYWGEVRCSGGITLTTTTLPTTPPSSYGCYSNGRHYMPGETISSGQSGHWCYSSLCGRDGQIINADNFHCNIEETTIPTTVPPYITTTSPFFTTPLFCFYTDPKSGNNHVWVGGSDHTLKDGTRCRCEYWGRVHCDDTAVGKK